jgi:glycosyltransferase involved in cell wall biosynthesis
MQVLEPITPDFEVIVVDDGSRDGSYAVVAEYHRRDPRIKGLRLSRRFGKEAALHAGLAHASGQATITMDADLQHPPECIPEFVARWRTGAAIVHGIKRECGHAPSVSRWATHAFNWLLTRLADLEMTGASDFKLLDRRVVQVLVRELPERNRFYRGLATWAGFSQATVPFRVVPRRAGETHWTRWSLARYAMRALTAFSSLPLLVVPLLGAVMLVFAFALGLEALISRLAGRSVSGFATLEMTVLFTGSLVMIGLGVIGQYLARIFDELKQRPICLIEAQVGFEQGHAYRHQGCPSRWDASRVQRLSGNCCRISSNSA